MVKKMKEATVGSKRVCVRINDQQNLNTKLFKNNIPDELDRERYRFAAKCAEQLARGLSLTSVAERTRYQQFQTFLEGLMPKTLPEGYHSFSRKQKHETVKKLTGEYFAELTAAAMSRAPVQGVDIQADSSGNLQVGAGSARQLDMTVREDVDMQVNNPGQIQADEVPAAAPNPDFGNTFSNGASSLNVATNQCENREGRPPSLPPVPPAVYAFIPSDVMHRASKFPEIRQEFQALDEACGSTLSKLESAEGACEDHSRVFSRARQEEIFPRLEGVSAFENVSTPPMDKELADEFWTKFLNSPEA